MRVLIVTAGSMGDVAPYTGVGVRLRDAGHQVTIAAHESFAGLVAEVGLEHLAMPGDARLVQASAAGRALHRRGTGPRGLVSLARLARRYVGELARGMLTVADRGADVLLLSSTTAALGYQVALARDIPSLGLFLQPADPTREFPPVMTGTRSLGPVGNRSAAALARTIGRSVYDGPSRQLRARLGLPPLPLAEVDRQQRRQRWPILYGFSPTVVARPADWRPGLDVVGYWWPATPAGWQPPPALVEFLDAGAPPVFVGFGSMAGGRAGRLSALALDALRRAGVRGVAQAGWAGLAVSGEDMLTIGPVPHDWLFPRMAAVVHHGGAGTTAAGLRAGVPAIAVPMLADQGFWAARLTGLGVSPASVPVGRLTVPRLAAAIDAAVRDPRYRNRAGRIADRIGAEDGAGAVVEAVDRLAGRQAGSRPGNPT